jgi:hypothetical protein
MAAFAHVLDGMLHTATPYLIAVAVILWVCGFGTVAVSVWRRGWRAQRPPSPLFVWPALGFGAIIALLVGAAVLLSHVARDELRSRLNEGVTGIQVDGRPAADPERLLSALRQITPHNYHHSHPTVFHRVQLQTSEGSLELQLGRDSAVPNEYWVFYPGFDQANDIGTVLTDVLD